MKPIRKDTPLEVFAAGLLVCACVGMFVYSVMMMFGG